jgi:hypothetical protein
MEISMKFTDETARTTEFFLRERYKSKAGLKRLAKLAVLEIAAIQAKHALDLSNEVQEMLERGASDGENGKAEMAGEQKEKG